MKNKKLLYIIGALALAFSCQREVNFQDLPHGQKEVDFQVSVQAWQQDNATKGIPYGLDDKLEDLNLGVMAYTTSASGVGPTRYLETTHMAYDKSAKKWTVDKPLYWPDKLGTISFYAYAPFGKADVEAPEGSLPLLHYSTPEEITEQRGLLVFKSDPLPDYPQAASGTKVELTFHHILSAVTFIIGEGISIESIAVSGIYDQGTYSYETGLWSSLAANRTYELKKPSMHNVDGFDVLDDEYTLMFPPQICPEGANLHLVADGKELDIPLTGHNWKEGHIVAYVLGRNDYNYHFDAGEIPDLDWEGGNVDIALESWRDKQDSGNLEAVPFVIEGYYATEEDAEAATNKLSDCFVTATITGDPDQQGKTALHVTYSPAEPFCEEFSKAEIINAYLAAAEEKGSATRTWNLSNPEDGGNVIMESANTYVVSGPGYYRIPLAMGNGIQENFPVPKTYYYDNFKDYLDNPVDSPLLHKSSTGVGVPTTAQVIWESAPLVDVVDQTGWEVAPVGDATSAISFDERVYWLNFHIPATSISQGLVHISIVDDSDRVMWSYMIWVTEPETPSATGIASRNLGWIELGTNYHTIWESATAYIRLEQQKIGGKHLIVKIDRPYHDKWEEVSTGYSPYYQFGRKDPLIPGYGKDEDIAMSGLHPTFENSTSYGSKSSVGRSIQNPWLHLTYDHSPYDWCIAQGEENWWLVMTDGKTIYDPCPVGYRVPESSDMEGWADLDLYPCGRRNSMEGQLVNVGKYRYYWSATTVDENSVRIYTDDPEMSSGLGRRSRGLTILPVQEK